MHKIAESAVLYSQQNRDLLDLHFVITDFFLTSPTGLLNFKSSQSHLQTDGDWQQIGRNACCLGYRQQPGCLLLFLFLFYVYYLICDSVVTETNVTTIMQCLVCHNMAHDILIGHQFRQLQILVLQLHIRKRLLRPLSMQLVYFILVWPCWL